MFPLDLVAEIKQMKDKFSNKNNYSVEEESDTPTHIKLLGIIFNLIISILFILFSIDYINVINPKLNIPNKLIYIVLVYLILIVNSITCVLNVVNLIKDVSSIY